MQLKITYRDKSVRVIRLCPDFFSPSKLRDPRTKKDIVISVERKAQSLAESYGSHPYKVLLTRDDVILVDHIRKENNPKFAPRTELHIHNAPYSRKQRLRAPTDN